MRKETQRYRVLAFDFDLRANFMAIKVNDGWTVEALKNHEKGLAQVRDGVVAEFGSFDADRKMQDFGDFGVIPMSVLAFHNRFFRQVQTAFVAGAYYCALTGTCALGERILNHLILRLRKYFRGTPAYKKVHDKGSFDDWNLAITTLEGWGVLRPEVVAEYRRLKDIRNKAIHFKPEVDTDDRDLALKACRSLASIIDQQFGGFGLHPWFIPGTTGASFIKRSAEDEPFIREVYLPNCRLVGPSHRLVRRGEGFSVASDPDVTGVESLTDEEFAALFNKKGG